MAETTAASYTSSPVDINYRAQLFVEQSLVHASSNIAFTLHPAQKHPANPLVRTDLPWEGWRLGLFGNVLFDEEAQLFKMWYLGETRGHFEVPRATLYATSANGIDWDKPEVGTLQANDPALRHNVVAPVELASVMKDLEDPDPGRRYKMIAMVKAASDNLGYHTFISPDGLKWTQLSKEPFCRGSDVITGYYDERRKLFVAFPRELTPARGHERRVFYRVTSTDFENWSEREVAFTPDTRDDAGTLHRIEASRSLLSSPDDPLQMRTEFYGTGIYTAESTTIAFPWVFSINSIAPASPHQNQEGPCEIQLAASREGHIWERPFRTPAISLGAPGEWDCGFLTTQSRALRVGDEVWLYYAGSNHTHGNPCLYAPNGPEPGSGHSKGIGLAKWKVDRFVSADGPAEGGTLTTVPVVFSGNKLVLNATTKLDGNITVEILDPSGTRQLARSQPCSGDNLRRQILWSPNFDLQSLARQPVTVRFHIQNASLYSFAFR